MTVSSSADARRRLAPDSRTPAGKRALVVSGGGAKGAWAVGVLKFLMKDLGERFDLVVGTSTGALIAPYAVLGEIDALIAAYTSVYHSDILQFRLPTRNVYANAVVAVATGRDAIFGTGPLRRTVERLLTDEHWRRLQESPSEAWVSTVNMQTSKLRYFGSREDGMDRLRFIDAMVASASIPFAMTQAQIRGERTDHRFVDGGVKDLIPLGQAIRLGATDIAVIILGPDMPPESKEFRRTYEVLFRTIGLQGDETADNDIEFGQLVTRELWWRRALEERLVKAGVDPALVERAKQDVSACDEPLAADDDGKFRPYVAARLRVIRPAEEIGDTLEFHQERMKEFLARGYAAAQEAENWKVYPDPAVLDRLLG